MQTAITPEFAASARGREADRILRQCVHCGFCNATCPTYQLLGDELDGPRGRIYQIKQLLEGAAVTARTRLHLDRCLTCRNCETTCPSGVPYARLLEIGRELVEERAPRPVAERWVRAGLLRFITTPALFGPALVLGRACRPLLPAALRAKVPPARPVPPGPAARPAATRQRWLLLEGCAQPAIAPGINAAARAVFARLGMELVSVPQAGCCGAAHQHTSAPQQARALARRNLDAWQPQLDAGAAGLLITASGCGVHVKDYGHLLADDPAYAARAAQLAALTRDPVEVLEGLDLTPLRPAAPRRIAFHAPCTLQHGMRLAGRTEALLRGLGFELLPVGDAHLCCGSAGTYSVLQPRLATQLRDRKLAALAATDPELIATANVGCLAHLAGGTGLPVRHWLELLA
jgi:glycolate oxidase iron-sulfur subunit